MTKIPLPYFTSSVLIAFLISDFGMILFRYLDTGDFVKALQLPIYLAGNAMIPSWFGYLSSTFFFLVYLYTFHFIRHTGLLILNAEKDLDPLIPKEGPSYREIFKRFYVSRVPRALLMVFIIPFILYFFTVFQYSAGIFSVIQAILLSTVGIVLMFSVLVTYAGALKGLYEFGKQPLLLKPFYEDQMLGLRKAGSFSFSIFFHYSLFLLLFTFALSISPFQHWLFLLGTGFMSALGAVFFFLPLLSCHTQMQKRKRLETDKIRKRFVPLLKITEKEVSSVVTVDDLCVRELQALDIIERKVMAIYTWPFNTGIVARLSTLTLLPILLGLIGKFVQIILFG